MSSALPVCERMTFATDLATDRDNVFLNTDEFGETVTYRVAATGATSSVPAEIEDEGDSIISDGMRAQISAGDVAAPAKGDQITRGGAVFTVQFLTDEVGIWILDCEREEKIT